MTLSALDLETLEVLVEPSGWAYHQALPAAKRVDVQRAWRVRRDVRLVAVDVLNAAATEARRLAGIAAGAIAVQQVKLGKIEAKLTGGVSGLELAGAAAAWTQLAADLRAQVAAEVLMNNTAGSCVLDVEVGF